MELSAIDAATDAALIDAAYSLVHGTGHWRDNPIVDPAWYAAATQEDRIDALARVYREQGKRGRADAFEQWELASIGMRLRLSRR